MPTIQLTDQFGLDVDVTTDILSSLEKYAANLSKISLSDLNLQSIADLTLADPSITSLHAGLNLDQPVDIGSGGVTLKLNAGLSGTLDIYVPPKGGGQLFKSDLTERPFRWMHRSDTSRSGSTPRPARTSVLPSTS